MQLSEQMQANVRRLDIASRTTGRAFASLVKIIELTGPEPTLVSTDSLTTLFVNGFSPNTAELETSAMDMLLASAEFASADAQDQELRRHLITFRTRTTGYNTDRELFVDTRERFIDYLIEMGVLHAVSATAGMHPPTDFEIPVQNLLANPRTASWAGNLSVTASRLVNTADALRARADSVLAAVTTR